MKYSLSKNSSLIAIILFSMSLSFFYALFSPTFRGPDEPQHADLVLALRAGEGFAPPMDHLLSFQMITSLPIAQFYTRSENLEKTADIPRGQRPTFDQLSPPKIRSLNLNQISQHPPLYTMYVAVFSEVLDRVTPNVWSFEQEIFVMRLANIPLIGILVYLCYTTCIAAGRKRQEALLAATVPLLIPQLMWIGGVVNNDNLLMVLMTGATLMACKISRGDLSLRTSIFTGLWFGAALLTKPFAIVGLAMIFAAYIVGATGNRRIGFLRFITSMGVAFILSAWWYLRNYLRYQTFLPKSQMQIPKKVLDTDVVHFTSRFIERMTQSFFGKFGWLDIKNPDLYAFIMLALFVCLGMASLFAPDLRRRVANYVMVISLIICAYLFAFKGYMRTGKLVGLQGRYIFGAVASLALILVIGVTKIIGHRLKPVVLGVLLIAGGIQAYAVLIMLRTWYGPPSTRIWSRFSPLIDWSPVPIGFTLLSIVTVVACCIGTFACVLREKFDTAGEIHI